MVNWKTTAAGILAALGAAMSLVPLPDNWKWVGPFLTALGSGLLGITAKDYNVHSTVAEVEKSSVDVREAAVKAAQPKI